MTNWAMTNDQFNGQCSMVNGQLNWQLALEIALGIGELPIELVIDH